VSSLVKPEFGPTLAEIAGPRWPRLRVVLIVLGVAIAVWLGVKWFWPTGDPRTVEVVKAPVAVNVLKNAQLKKVAPQGDEELRLVSTQKGVDQTFTVTPLTLPAYPLGDPGVALPVFASAQIAAMKKADPALRVRSEGRTRVNLYPGYAITYDTMRGDKRYYGKRIFLYPDEPNPTEGVQIDMLAPRVGEVPLAGPNDVGNLGPTKLPLRSFNFGTERP
jgi:hypothetical protein